MNRFKRTFLIGTALLGVLLFSSQAQAGKFGYFDDSIDNEPRYNSYNPAPNYQNNYSGYYEMQQHQQRLENQRRQLSRDQARAYQEFNRSHQYMRRSGRHRY